jgi:hypothetical protein
MEKIRRLEALSGTWTREEANLRRNQQTQTDEAPEKRQVMRSGKPDAAGKHDVYKNAENEMKQIIENLQKEKELVMLDCENLNTNNYQLEKRI